MSHFYLADPEPAPFYETPYADPSKGMRPTTLADARKVGAFPSPNDVVGILAKPGIERWKRNIYGECVIEATVIHSSLTEEGDFVKLETHNTEIKAEANHLFTERMDAAPSAGTDIHAAIENAICKHYKLTDEPPHPPKDVDERIIQAALNWLVDNHVLPIAVEKVFANPVLGYGGKIDLVGKNISGRAVVVDWKSINTTEGKKIGDYWKDKTPILAAYGVGDGHGLAETDYWNVFLSRNEPGRIEGRPYTVQEMLFGWRKFQLAYELWVLENNYDPRQDEVK